jgi:D,D-heptose 1,7-bisphosphate phosphatase
MRADDPTGSAIARRAIFLDRDDTLIVDRGYLSDPADVTLLPGVIGAIRRFRDAGFLCILVTNQSGIGRGYFTSADMDRVNRRMQDLMGEEGAQLDAIYFCPHAPGDGCACRKPAPGMLIAAAAEWRIDLAGSFMIGDKLADVEAAKAAGVAGILLRTKRNAADSASVAGVPIFANLAEAASSIVAIH